MSLYRNKLVDFLIWRLVFRNPKFRYYLQRLIYPNKEMFVRLGGAEVFINSQREIGYYRAARIQEASIVFRDELPQIIPIISLLEDDMTFVDCGANVGFWTANIARLSVIFRRLTVLSFEPNPETFSRLRKTVEHFKNVTVHNLAVSNRECTLTMMEGAVSGVFGVNNMDFFQIADATREVPGKPLDTFAAQLHGRVIIKIDVEGHELEVLQGAKSILQSGVVKAIYIDGMQKRDEEAILSILQELGMTLLDGRTLLPFERGNFALLALNPALLDPRVG
jgi:FkbM family methyltransferase